MTTYTIDLGKPYEDGSFYFLVDLDGVDYRIDFQFNSREGFWYFDLRDLDGNILRAGVKVVSNFPLLIRLVGQDRPGGELINVDTRVRCEDPILEDLGITSAFCYLDAEGLAEALVG